MLRQTFSIWQELWAVTICLMKNPHFERWLAFLLPLVGLSFIPFNAVLPIGEDGSAIAFEGCGRLRTQRLEISNEHRRYRLTDLDRYQVVD